MSSYGGTYAAAGSYPSLGRTVDFGFFCYNAMLIHDDIMITRAACLAAFEGEKIFIGGIERDGSDANEERTVLFEYPHPDFERSPFYSLSNDIMLLKLDSASKQPKIALNRNVTFPQIGDIAKAIHFYEKIDMDEALQELNMTVTSCTDATLPTVNSIHFCADESPTNTACEGYSHANPIIFNNILLGLLVEDYCGDYPVVYTSISGYSSWIDAAICDISDFPPASCSSLQAPSSAPSLDSSKRSPPITFTYNAAVSPASPKNIPKDSYLNISIVATNVCDAVSNMQVQLTVANSSGIDRIVTLMQSPKGFLYELISATPLCFGKKSAPLPFGTTIIIDDLSEFTYYETLRFKCASGTCPKKITSGSDSRRLNSFIGDFFPSLSTWSLLMSYSTTNEDTADLLSAQIVLTCQPFASMEPSSRPSLKPSSRPSLKPSSLPSNKPSIQKITTTNKSCGILGKNILCPPTLCGILGRKLGFCNPDKSCSIIDRILGKCS